MSKAYIKMKTVKRPISGDEIGFRLQAAVPNCQGGKFDKPDEHGRKVNFGKQYLVAESSDYTSISERQIDSFLEGLRFQGFTEFVMV
jgi:hypothetical protein